MRYSARWCTMFGRITQVWRPCWAGLGKRLSESLVRVSDCRLRAKRGYEFRRLHCWGRPGRPVSCDQIEAGSTKDQEKLQII